MLTTKSAFWILILALIALMIFVFQLWRRRRKRFRLEKDASGFWRYHRESEFEKREAYEKLLHKGVTAEAQKPMAVIHFSGDLRARHHQAFARAVDEVVINREEFSEIVVVITSGGGFVSQYGHLYSQMERLRELQLPLTVCIDVVAASGGYLMCIPATRIIAAPFSIVGSVGVVAFVPNFRKMLQEWAIEPRTFTAGKYKRTVSLTDDASPEEVARFQRQLENIHRLFLASLQKYRPGVKREEIETGDHWTAQESVDLGLGLVDVIGTSQQYLLEQNKHRDLVAISDKKGFFEEMFGAFSSEVAARISGIAGGQFGESRSIVS